MPSIEKMLYLATEKYPYFARGFYAMIPIDTPNVTTIGVDKYWRLYYNQDFLDATFSGIRADIIAHELEHLIRAHHERVCNRESQIWNIATDAEINDDYPELTRFGVSPTKIGCNDHETAEFYYNHMVNSNSCDLDVVIQGHGSGSDGVQRPWEHGAPDEKNVGIDLDSASTLLDNIADDIISHSKQAGEVPNNLIIWANARKNGHLPKISWKRIIANKIRSYASGRVDFTYSKISRRQTSSTGVVLPALHRPIVSVGCIVDTSGSMNDMGDWIGGCLHSITQMRCNSSVISCDAEIANTFPLRNWTDVRKCMGGGGTDMRPAIEYAKNKFDLLIVLTDGYTPWPDVWPKNMFAVIRETANSNVIVKGHNHE